MLHQPTRLIELPLSRITVDRRLRRDLGAIDDLAASIAELGLLKPIVVTAAHKLVSGMRRIEALRLLGSATAMCAVVASLPDAWALLSAETQENTCRKSFSPSEAVAAAEQLLPLATEAVRGRRGVPVRTPSVNFRTTHRALDDVAAMVGLSSRTLEKALKVVEAARMEPHRFADLIHHMDATGKVHGAYRTMRIRQGKANRREAPKARVTGCTLRMDRHGRITLTGSPNRLLLIDRLKTLVRRTEQELYAHDCVERLNHLLV